MSARSKVRRARGLVHGRQLARLLEGNASASISALDQLTSEFVADKFDGAGELSNTISLSSAASHPNLLSNTKPKSPTPEQSVECKGVMQQQTLRSVPPLLPAKNKGLHSHQLHKLPTSNIKTNAQKLSVPSLSEMSSAGLKERPLPAQPSKATDALKDLQGEWARSSKLSLPSGLTLAFERAQSVLREAPPTAGKHRPVDRRGSIDSNATSDMYDILREKHIDHPIDKPLPPVKEIAESSLRSVIDSRASTVDDPNAETWLTSGFDRVSIPDRSSQSSFAFSPVLQMPNPHDRKKSTQQRHSLSEESDQQQLLDEDRGAFLRFQDAERQRVAKMMEDERRLMEHRKRCEDDKKREQVLHQLKAEQSQVSRYPRPSAFFVPPRADANESNLDRGTLCPYLG